MFLLFFSFFFILGFLIKLIGFIFPENISESRQGYCFFIRFIIPASPRRTRDCLQLFRPPHINCFLCPDCPRRLYTRCHLSGCAYPATRFPGAPRARLIPAYHFQDSFKDIASAKERLRKSRAFFANDMFKTRLKINRYTNDAINRK